MKFLDQFFAAQENARLLIPQGILVLAMKMDGKTEAEIDGYLRWTRKTSVE